MIFLDLLIIIYYNIIIIPQAYIGWEMIDSQLDAKLLLLSSHIKILIIVSEIISLLKHPQHLEN